MDVYGLYIGVEKNDEFVNSMSKYFEVDQITYEDFDDQEEYYNVFFLDEGPSLSKLIKRLNQGNKTNILIMSKREDIKEQEEFINELGDVAILDVWFGKLNYSLMELRFSTYMDKILYKLFLNNMNLQAVITDDKSTILYANEAFHEESGYGEEVIGSKPSRLKSGEHSLMYYNNMYNTITNGMRWEGQLKNKRKDGTLYYEEAAIFPMELNGKRFYGKVAFNTTKHELLVSETQQSLKMATAIQQSLISEDVYEDDIIIRGYYRPLKNVSGDIYNLYRLGQDKYCVFLADVAGHGVGSGLLSTSIIAIANELIAKNPMPDVFLESLNNKIMKLLNSNDLSLVTYFTSAYLVIDTKEGIIHYANCGHPQIYVLEDGKCSGLSKVNFSLGMFSDVDFEYASYKYKAGSKLLLYTDGLIELEDHTSNGKEELEEVLESYIKLEKQPSLLKYLEAEILEPLKDKINDDITLIGIDM